MCGCNRLGALDSKLNCLRQTERAGRDNDRNHSSHAHGCRIQKRFHENSEDNNALCHQRSNRGEAYWSKELSDSESARGEEDGVWLYELRLIDDENSVIKVGYRADNLEMVWLKGHHLERLFEPRPPPEEE